MEKIKIGKGEVLHKKGDVVKSLEIILAGALQLTDGNGVEVRLDSGSLVGAVYQTGEIYSFDIVALMDCVLVVIDYRNEDSIAEAVMATPAIAPVMASASMAFSKALLESLSINENIAADLCKEIKRNYMDYSFLCVKLETEPQKFSFIEAMITPEPSKLSEGWEAKACLAFCANSDEIKKGYLAMDVSFCVSVVMQAAETGRRIRKSLEAASTFISWTKAGSADFVRAYYDVKSKLGIQDRENADGSSHLISDALEIILAYSGIDAEVADAFRKDVKAYTEVEDRRAKSDEMRSLRMSISKGFYQIYEAAFFNSMESTHVPIEVRMFLLFGFVDEVLAGSTNTAELYNMAVGWEEDPDGRILPMCDWLKKIYDGEATPSKNQFDNDWKAYLREAVRTSQMTQREADELMDDRVEMVKFEIHNLFMTANRLVSGHLSSFVPIFSAQDVIRPLDKSLSSVSVVRKALDNVIDVDYGCFYRPATVELPRFNMQRFIFNQEIRPYFILMPNVGERGIMWQEIEGASRQTPAHMLMSIFHVAELEETMTRMCADFRWEMCRRIQGVHYADITEHSLTSEYMNYLQFYKKNSNLSNEVKENVKLALQKARNDYKAVFIKEYSHYILSESQGRPRLNKVARDIIFRYCTLSKKYRASLASNTQFAPLIDRWRQKQGAKIHTIELLEQKLTRMLRPGEELPGEIQIEKDFLLL